MHDSKKERDNQQKEHQGKHHQKRCRIPDRKQHLHRIGAGLFHTIDPVESLPQRHGPLRRGPYKSHDRQRKRSHGIPVRLRYYYGCKSLHCLGHQSVQKFDQVNLGQTKYRGQLKNDDQQRDHGHEKEERNTRRVGSYIPRGPVLCGLPRQMLRLFSDPACPCLIF